MPIRVALWKVGAPPVRLAESSLAKEQLLEEMIVASPQLISDEWMLIGRQEETTSGGRIDLLAIAPDGSLVLIELKRDRTPRDVVAQALDYAAWVETLQGEDIAAIYGRFAPERSLADDFRERFGYPLDEESLNQSHQLGRQGQVSHCTRSVRWKLRNAVRKIRYHIPTCWNAEPM